MSSLKNNEAAGIFDSFDDALDEGYKRSGLVPFLVKKLEKNESVLYFSRPV